MVTAMRRNGVWRLPEAFALVSLFISAVVFIVEIILGHPGFVSNLLFEALIR